MFVTEEHDPIKGYTLKVGLEDGPFHPFEDDDGKIVTFIFEHRKYNLGDMNRETFAVRNPDLADEDGNLFFEHSFSVTPDRVLACEVVEMLDHSGLRFYLQKDRLNGSIMVPYAGWDSGVIGVALVTREDFERVGLDPDAPDARERAEREVRSAVSVLDQYHSGQVYAWQIEDPDGEVPDDCEGYGYYDEPDMTAEQAAERDGKSMLEHILSDLPVVSS
jgi:hypothetical protein